MTKSKMKINPITMEIEIEVSDTFLERYFQKLTDRFPKSKKLIPKIKSIKTKIKPGPKGRKTKSTRVVKMKKGSIQSGILERIKKGKDEGVSVDEIVESTGLKKLQIYSVTNGLKSKGIIKTSGRGNYIFIEKPEVSK
jgi:hypothetical protein